MPPTSSPVPLELNPAEIAAHEERRMALVLTELCDETTEIGGMTCGFAGPGSWANQAEGPPVEGFGPKEIEAITAWYEARDVNPKIVVTPHTHPQSLDDLRDAGYRLAGVELLYAAVVNARETAVVTFPPEMTLEAIARDDSRAVEDFVQFSLDAFDFSDASPALRDTVRRTATNPRGTTMRLRKSGQTVAVAGFGLFEKQAALYGAAVVQAERRRGLQLALIAHRCRLAAEVGARFVTVSTAALGGTERNALRAGFQQITSKLEWVRPRPGEAVVPSEDGRG